MLFNPVYLNIAILILIFSMGFLYLVQVNKATTKGYQMRDLETRINVVEESNQKLEIQVTELQTLDSIKERSQTLGMVPTDKVKYIKVTGSTVAKK